MARRESALEPSARALTSRLGEAEIRERYPQLKGRGLKLAISIRIGPGRAAARVLPATAA
jgi:hypothetical protein